jgi:hypothetical protein
VATTRAAWPAHARLANRVLARELRRRTRAPLTDLGPMRAARRAPAYLAGPRGWPIGTTERLAYGAALLLVALRAWQQRAPGADGGAVRTRGAGCAGVRRGS